MSGDAPRILLWECASEVREIYDHRRPGAQIDGLRHGPWWPGLEKCVWSEIDHALAATDLDVKFCGASSFNTPEIAGRWAVQLLRHLDLAWSPAWTVDEQALVHAIDEWKSQR